MNVNSTGGQSGADVFNLIGASNTLESMAAYNQYTINGGGNAVTGNAYANIMYEPNLGSNQTFNVQGDNNVIHDNIGYSFFNNNNLTIVGSGTLIKADWGMSGKNCSYKNLGGGNIINVIGDNTSIQSKEIDCVQMTITGNNTNVTSSGLTAQGLEMGACVSDNLSIIGAGTNVNCNGSFQYGAIAMSGDNTTITTPFYVFDTLSTIGSNTTITIPNWMENSFVTMQGNNTNLVVGNHQHVQGNTVTVNGVVQP